MGRWIGAVLLVLACNTPDPLPKLSARIDGRVWFQGPVAEAPVQLHERTIDGELLGAVAETVTDGDGRFIFQGLRETGPFAIRVELADPLLAPVDEVQPFSPEAEKREVFVAVSPWTTLLMATAEARRKAGEPRPLFSASQDFNRWLGFAVNRTDFESDSSVRPAVEHTLLTEALVRLADRIGAQVGVDTLVDAPALLQALRADALGEPPGVFDGHGPEGLVQIRGVGEYALSAHTLQSELLAALDEVVEDPGSGWDLSLADLRPLRERLACAGTGLFPECADAALDETPPVLVDVKPEPENVEPFSGVIDVRVRFTDPEGQVVEITLERLRDARGGVVETYAGEDGLFLVDTTSVIGNGTLHLRAQARNDSGLWSAPHQFSYAIRNVGEGVLGGQVYKGVAAGITVTAFGRSDGIETELARATTDVDGRFGLRLTEYQGRVRLLASAGAEGTFNDEARGQTMRWPEDGTLQALVLDYDPRNGVQSVTVSPFSDLALALAEVWARRGDGGLDDRYRFALGRLSAHLGLQGADTLVSGVPAPMEPVNGVEDAERFLLALACLAEQARGLAVEAFPEAPENFNALDLLALYRADAQDGLLDGLSEGSAVEMAVDGQVVQLPIDGFRNDLATACARWLGGAHNPTGMETATVVHLLEQMAQREDTTLFGETVDPQPFDREGPRLQVEVEGYSGPPWVVAGSVTVRVEAFDEAGVDWVRVALLDGVDDLLVAEDAEPTEEVLRRRGVVAELDVDALPAEFEQTPVRLQVTAADQLGHESSQVVFLQADRIPPVVEVVSDAIGVDGNDWHTNAVAPIQFELVATDNHLNAVWAEFAGERIFEGEGAEHTVEVNVGARPEGRYPLTACASDILDRETCVARTVVVDRTPPTAELLPSRYLDERAGVTRAGDPPFLDLRDAPRLEWDPAATPWALHKTQVTLGDRAYNLPPVVWQLRDAETPVSLLEMRHEELLPEVPDTQDQRVLRLSATALGVDVAAPPADGTVWRGDLTIRDLAGNEAVVETPDITLHITAPPPLIEARPAPRGVVRARTLSLGGPALQAVLDGDFIEFGRFRISNPWPVRLYMRAPQAAVRFAVVSTDGPEVVATGDGLPEHYLPESGPDYDRLVLPDCMFRRDAFGNRVPDTRKALRARRRLEGRTLFVEPAPGQDCEERAARRAEDAVRQPEAESLETWERVEAAEHSFRVSAPGPQPLDGLGALLRSRFDQPHSRLLDVSFDPVLQFHEPQIGCVVETDPWGCRRGWWQTRRIRRVDTLFLHQPGWRLEWAPGGDEACADCATAGLDLAPEAVWRVD